MTFRPFWLLAVTLLCGCPRRDEAPVDRCPLDLHQTQRLFSFAGSGAQARVATAEDLPGGPFAQGVAGDLLLENDRIRAVVQQPGRNLGPNPYGGNLIDADLVRPDAAGRDQLGKLGVLYAFGRTVNVQAVEILADGSEGGPAVVAASGDDAVNDFLNVRNMLGALLGGEVALAVDPEAALPLRITTYYALSPGESRVRVVTALCNRGADRALIPIGDLVDRGGAIEYFNPRGCGGGMGSDSGCFIEPSSWYGFQGDGVAYGLRPYSTDDPSAPQLENGLLTVAGVSVTLAGGEGSSGVLSWVDPGARRRPGTFVVPPGESRLYVRDLVVGADLAAVSATWLALDGAPSGTVRGTAPPSSRVALESAGRLATLAVAGPDGHFEAQLPPGSYAASAALARGAVGTPVDVAVAAGAVANAALSVPATRTLSLAIADPFGAPIPGKAVVLCPGPCAPRPASSSRLHFEAEVLPSEVAAIAVVPPSGAAQVELPPGVYDVVVFHGPEWSVWPDGWPLQTSRVDLTATGASISAVLGHVVDSTGWTSADLHVHAVNSPDSNVTNAQRVLGFAADGVDVLCSTDHDHVTDYAPIAREVGADGVLATMIGSEITPFDWGHYNAYPIVPGPGVHGASPDWAGGDGPSLRPSQLFEDVKGAYPGAVLQLNHPRGAMGALTLLRVDTATLATHADPARFRMTPAPDATPTDTRLLSDRFDALEVHSGPTQDFAVLNDWMTFLSRGLVRTATATSDSHHAFAFQGGYPRTWVRLPEGAPFDAAAFAESLRAGRAVGSNGPLLRATAQRLSSAGDAIGAPVEVGGTISLSPTAGETLRIDVDVQAPEWMSFDWIELYAHAPGREAVDGVGNADWPEARILARRTVPVASLPLEPVVQGTLTFRRVHVVESFTVSPSEDGWYAVLLRSSAQARPLYPMHFAGVQCDATSCLPGQVRPFAFTNAFLVDADGTGRYDRFPLTAPRSRRPISPGARAISAAELARRLPPLVRGP